MTEFSLWLDSPDALEQIEARSGGDEFLGRVAKELIETGFTVLRGVQDKRHLKETIADYARYVEENAGDAAQNADPEGRHFRLTNFHLYSESALRIGTSPIVMRALDFIFGRKAAVYTSLTFEYSTEQRLHRDAPFFCTFPEGQFVGVWSALEDVNPDAGPLSYVPGSHRFSIDHRALFRRSLDLSGDETTARSRALGEYSLMVERESSAVGDVRFAVLRAGDTAIWHPQLVHGGSPQRNPALTRRSVVFHCTPESVMCYADDVFFRSSASEPAAPPYGYSYLFDRAHAEFGRPNFGSAR